MSNQQNNQFQEYVNSKERATKSNTIEVPSISLPKGGGALKGIDEKFSVNAVNGTAAFSVQLLGAPIQKVVKQLSLLYILSSSKIDRLKLIFLCCSQISSKKILNIFF